MRQNMATPCSVRKHPETFCWTLIMRRSRSAWLLDQALNYRHNWGEYRVIFYETPDHVRSLPAVWTSLVSPDPSVLLAAGRAPFQVKDLLALAQLVQRIEERKEDAEC